MEKKISKNIKRISPKRLAYLQWLDNNPKLKRLPNEIKEGITRSSMKKMSALTKLEEDIRDTYMLTPAVGAVSAIVSYNKQKNKLRNLGMTEDEIREALQGNVLNAAARGGAIGLGTQLIPRNHIPEITTSLGKLSRGSIPILGAIASSKYETMRGNQAERRFKKNKR